MSDCKQDGVTWLTPDIEKRATEVLFKDSLLLAKLWQMLYERFGFCQSLFKKYLRHLVSQRSKFTLLVDNHETVVTFPGHDNIEELVVSDKFGWISDVSKSIQNQNLRSVFKRVAENIYVFSNRPTLIFYLEERNIDNTAFFVWGDAQELTGSK